MTGALVIAILGTTSSGAAGDTPLADSWTLVDGSSVSAPVNCAAAKRAVRYYAARVQYWRDKMGAGASGGRVVPPRSSSCPRYPAHVLQRKARALRLEYEREWHWQRWLPRLWYAIGMCETQLNWQHNSGTYQGAFGFWYGTWDSYKPRGAPAEAYLASPRQQYQAALNVASRVGLGAWGCYSGGGYRYHLGGG